MVATTFGESDSSNILHESSVEEVTNDVLIIVL